MSGGEPKTASRSKDRLVWITLVVVPVLFVAIAALQVSIDARTRSAASQRQELLLRSGPLVKKLSLGYDPLLADIYWTRAVQYYGARIGKLHADYDLLWPLLDLTTTLDPRLLIAYRFGAIFLSEPPPIGAGRTDQAIELVKRGIAANPDAWRLNSDLGFLYYWRLKDYPNAAAAYLAASRVPNSPPWLKLMAARVADKGGSIETSRMIWSELYESSKDPNMRKNAFEKLRGLKAQEDEMHLDEFAEVYRKRFGHYPASTKEMRDAGVLNGIPVDPDGLPYRFGPDGKSRLDPRSSVVIEQDSGSPAK
jgi:tetratricopeptide (TPR) repeat protein